MREHAKRVHDAVYSRYYCCSSSSSSGDVQIDQWFDSVIPEPPTAVAMKKDFWRFVPLFWRLQKGFSLPWLKISSGCPVDENNNNTKNFGGRGSRRGSVVFPVYSVGAKHLLYDGSALLQLLRHVDKTNTPSTWSVFNAPDPETGEAGARKYWKRYFSVPRNGKFGYSKRTDAVSVSLTMIRKKKKKKLVKGEEFDPDESKKK